MVSASRLPHKMRAEDVERWVAERKYEKVEECLPHMTPELIGSLSVRTITHLSPDAVRQLTEMQLAGMTEFQVRGPAAPRLLRCLQRAKNMHGAGRGSRPDRLTPEALSHRSAGSTLSSSRLYGRGSQPRR